MTGRHDRGDDPPSVRTLLGETDRDAFVRRHWRRRPHFAQRACPCDDLPLDPDVWAGFACEPEVESRLVLVAGDEIEVEHGPFRPERLAALPDRNWTLLIHDAGALAPELDALSEAADVVPAWRRDDVMLSLSAPGGSVGPHTDSYDVFLVQARGTKRWSLSRHATPRASADDLAAEPRLVEPFPAEVSYLAGPGDVLYLPPHLAHHGIAETLSITLSVGFYAPSRAELWRAALSEPRDAPDPWGDERYADDDLAPPSDPTLLDAATLGRLRAFLSAPPPLDDESLARWFGCWATRGRSARAWDEPDTRSRPRAEGARSGWRRCPGTRILHYPAPGDRVWLFAAGERHELPARLSSLAALLARARRVEPATWRAWEGDPEAEALMERLVEEGVFEPVEASR